MVAVVGMITYHQLETFLAVARTGSLTKAARELNSTQPTVSLQLHALRKFLGQPIFERPSGTFRLTPVGEKLRRYAEGVLGDLRVLQQDAAAVTGKLAGPLAVGATFVVSRYVLPTALHRFRDQFPDVDLQLHLDGPPDQLFGKLLSNALDAVVCIRVRIPPGLIVERLYDEDLMLIVSPRHPLARRRRVTARDVSAEPFVAPVTPGLREILEERLRAADITPQSGPQGRHHDAIKTLVERSAGYSLLIKSSVAAELARGRLVALTLEGPQLRTEMVVVLRARSAVSPLVRGFVEFLHTELLTEHQRAGERQAPPGRRRSGTELRRRRTR